MCVWIIAINWSWERGGGGGGGFYPLNSSRSHVAKRERGKGEGDVATCTVGTTAGSKKKGGRGGEGGRGRGGSDPKYLHLDPGLHVLSHHVGAL